MSKYKKGFAGVLAIIVAIVGLYAANETIGMDQCLFDGHADYWVSTGNLVMAIHHYRESAGCSHEQSSEIGEIFAEVRTGDTVNETIDLHQNSFYTDYIKWGAQASYSGGSTYVRFKHKDVPRCTIDVDITVIE